jgi:cytochrome c2
MKNAVLVLTGAALILTMAVVVFSAAGNVDAGKAVYATLKCKMCHSISGEGNTKWPLDGVGKKLKADEIVKWTKTPKAMKADSIMKAYPDISQKDMDDLTAYLLSLKQ